MYIHTYIHTIYISDDVPPDGFFFSSYIHKIKTCTTYLKILLDFSMMPYNDLFDLISSLWKTHNQPSKQPPRPPFPQLERFGIESTVGKTGRNGETGKGGIVFSSYIHILLTCTYLNPS